MINSLLKSQIIRVLTQYLRDTCEIQRIVDGVGVFGQPARRYEVVASSVPCRVIRVHRANQSTTASIAGQEALTEMYRLVVPPGTVLGTNYRVVFHGETYEVESVLQSLTDSVFTEAYVTRVRP